MPIPLEVPREPTDAPARETVLNYLRHWIVDGTLQPGEIIRDSEIAERFSVSRTPVREALLQLRFEGLVVMKPKGWTQVKPLDLSQIEAHLRVVDELEALAARLAAETPDPDLSLAEAANVELEVLLERSAKSANPEIDWQLIAMNDRFHDAIIDISGNMVLAEALRPIKARMRRYEQLYFDRATPIDRNSVAQHNRLLDAIRAGDGNTAAAVARLNLANSPVRTRSSIRRIRVDAAEGIGA